IGTDTDPALPQSPSIQCDQAFPMPFRSWLVVTPALRESEAVMHAGMQLNLSWQAGTREQATQVLDHRQWRQLVVFGTGDVELAFDFAEVEMWAFFRIADQPGAIERRGGSDAIGIACRGSQRVRATHAVAMCADRARLGGVPSINKRQHRCDVIHHGRNG